MAGEGAREGWGSTPTEAPAAAGPGPSCLPAALLRGWRRTALYCILVLLMLLIFLNIGLTLWIISSLKLRMPQLYVDTMFLKATALKNAYLFPVVNKSVNDFIKFITSPSSSLSQGGLGPINIIKGGIELEGQAYVTDNLVASSISSRVGQPITVHSYRNFSVLVSEPGRKETAKLLLKRDSVVCSGRTFEVRDAVGDSVFRASRDEVRVFADSLAVDGRGGLTVDKAVQAPIVRAPPGADLQLESLTRHLYLRAPQSIHLESRAGGIDISSHSNIKLDSAVGALKIDTPSIFISNLKEAVRTNDTRQNNNLRPQKVYQLCSCASGKLFLAAAEVSCAANDADRDFCR